MAYHNADNLPTSQNTVNTTLASWLTPILLNMYTYYVYYGGRAGAKSTEIAKCIIILSLTAGENYRNSVFLCCREIQQSIADSIYAVLERHIYDLKLENYFIITKTEIISRTLNIKIIFKGLYRNISSIKSIDNVRLVFIDEAATISSDSWEKLIPTVTRNDGVKIIVAFNPENTTDVVYDTFLNSDAESNTYIQKVTYRDNPYPLPVSFYEEMERMKKRDYERYLHIYEGECLKLSNSVVFKNYFEVSDFEIDKNIHKYVGLDFGFSESATACTMCYIKDNNLYICYEAVSKKLEIDRTGSFIEARIPHVKNYVWYCDSARPETITFLKKQGYNVKAVEKGKGSIEDGIEYQKSFEMIYIHSKNCPETAREYASYSFKVDERSGQITNKLIDANNDCIDSIRYALEKCMKQRSLNYSKWLVD